MEEEVQTKTGLWFKVSSNGEQLIIDKAQDNKPSSKLSSQRTIIKKDFLTVYAYYDRWNNGEKGISKEISSKSQNTAYIFALINRYQND